MFATANSRLNFPFLGRWLLRGGVALAATAVWADPDNTTNTRLVAHAQAVYAKAQKRFHADPTNHVAAWEFARAAFDRAEFATGDKERAALAEAGIAACRGALAQNSNSAAIHFYLAMNLGQLARTKSLGALKIVNEIEREFKAACALNERFDHAGPHRNLGLLYRDAPSIGSVGSRSKARQHLLRAVELVPDYPGNRLCLAESAVQWRDTKMARRELAALDELWAAAQAGLAGPEWEASWVEWSARRDHLRSKLAESGKPLASPRGSD